MSLGELKVLLTMQDQLSGPAKAAEQNMGSASAGIKGHFGSIVGAAAGLAASVGGFMALKGGITAVINAAGESQKVAAQTTAVLQSTGDASGMSAQQVGDLATQLSKVTPVDDEVIQSAENMLLTFTNIGKDVFPQATQTTLDMATALGEDSTQAAMQLGKALNDPVQGVTALQRVGVKLTDGQKEQVKAMVAAGDTMGAQKLILGELTREFGGSAEAAGKTFPGQLAILKTQLGNVEETIGGALLPVLVQLAQVAVPLVVGGVNLLSQILPRVTQAFSNVAATLASVILPALRLLQQYWQPVAAGLAAGAIVIVAALVPAFYAWASAAAAAAVATIAASLPLIAIVAGVALAVGALYLAWQTNFLGIQGIVARVWAAVKPVLDAIIANLTQFWTDILPKLVAAWQNVQVAISAVATFLGAVFAAISGFITQHSAQIRTVLGGAWQFIAGYIQAEVAIVEGVIKAALDIIGGNWSKAWLDIRTALSSAWTDMQTAVQGAITALGLLIQQAVPALAADLAQWGQQFVAWVAPQIPPLLAELGALLVQLGGWLVGTALPTITAALLQWGQQFVAWVAPQIPPLLLELGKLLVQMGGWILGTAIPAIVANLNALAVKFVEWVAPQIPPLLAELGSLLTSLTGWVIGTAIPAAVSALAQLALKFVSWVATDVVPNIPGALNSLTMTMGGWIVGTALPWAAGALEGVGEALIRSLVAGIGNAVGAAEAAARSAVGSVVDAAKGAAKSLVPGFAGGVLDFAGGLAVVGENGPELVNLPRGSSVIPHDQSKRMINTVHPTNTGPAAALGGGTTVNVYGSPTFHVKQASDSLPTLLHALGV